jgi:TPR repeat protein
MFYYGIGADEDEDLGIKWFKKSANNGNIKAQQALVHLYYRDEIEEIDFKKSIDSFKSDAEN